MPALLSRDLIRMRLQEIFPEGIDRRADLVSMVAASTIYTALYIGAIEGEDVWLGPKHVYRMTVDQAALTGDADRLGYIATIRRPNGEVAGQRWYQDTTRESIRDDTLREGLVVVGAVMMKTGLPTTSSKPRYALRADFAALFDPLLEGNALDTALSDWRSAKLNKGALARLAIVRQGAGQTADAVLVKFPNGETRLMSPGPSSEITRAVVEVFAIRFLAKPAVLSISESGNKVVQRDLALAQSVGLNIQADENLPDVVLVDLEPEHPLLVFVEVVASDGPVGVRRKAALEKLATGAGFPTEHVAFVTAYLDRSAGPFKKTVNSLAWGTYAWFAAEPEQLMMLSENTARLRGRP
ncbi:BsuBI/PstI family type II restriction endonuclease [Phenylobacterium immobile]|uniref:BsuBI/PstI family type II restriction endonuclease n=1 Tax=Phenylobacterium immobile TaxID=21 RepID=UPI001C4012E2|nr:BsuBI/PstI family type II restriction endonuclease [Phenylobacterium immobile]